MGGTRAVAVAERSADHAAARCAHGAHARVRVFLGHGRGRRIWLSMVLNNNQLAARGWDNGDLTRTWHGVGRA